MGEVIVKTTTIVTGEALSIEALTVPDESITVKSVVAGTNVTIDNTDPEHPIVNSEGGGTPITDYFKKGAISVADITALQVIGVPGSYGITLTEPWNDQTTFNLEISLASSSDNEQGQLLIGEITFQNGTKYRAINNGEDWGSWILVEGGSGKSAYQKAVDNGFEGTEAEWLISLKGTNGYPGTSVPINVCIFKSGANGILPATSYSWISNLIVSQVVLQDGATDVSVTINGTTYNKTTLIGVHLDSGVKMTGLDVILLAGQNAGSVIIIF